MRQRHGGDSGFVLLAVLMMAAGVAIMLYQQLPRVAFESMRAKEQALIDYGEQYQRAIQLYAAKWRRYPSTIEDLEKTKPTVSGICGAGSKIRSPARTTGVC
jgi:type II secretory pathway pseudopilin PulG